jgi:hypothetical protein
MDHRFLRPFVLYVATFYILAEDDRVLRTETGDGLVLN